GNGERWRHHESAWSRKSDRVPGDGRGAAPAIREESAGGRAGDGRARARAERVRACVARRARRARDRAVRAGHRPASPADRLQRRCGVRVTSSLALGLLFAAVWAGSAAAERPLTLGDAIRMALRKNEDLVIARESVTAASAGLRGARGAYDPVLELSSGWSRSTEPINSAFSGAPAGRFTPEIEATDGG